MSQSNEKYTNIGDSPRLTDDELILATRDHDDEAVDELLNRYKGLVRKNARALYLIGGDNDDLIQEGMIALYKAINSYDPSHRTGSFAAYASTCISNHLYNVIKGANRMKNAPLNQSVSLDAPISGASSETRTFADTLPPDIQSDPAQILIDRENVSHIEYMIRAHLSPLERDVVNLYIEGNSLSQIGVILSKSPKSIDNALQRVKKKLSEAG